MRLKGKVYILVFFFLLIMSIVSASTWLSDSSNFNEGTYSNTFLNGSFIQLNDSFSNGNYTSKIFDAGDLSEWLTISWCGTGNYELPNNKGISCDGEIDMANNVLLMHMDELSGTITDSSGKDNDGTSFGGLTYNVEGVINRSLTLDGIDDWINITSNNSINFEYNTPFSVIGWYKTSDTGILRLINKKDGANDKRGWSVFKYTHTADNGQVGITITNDFSPEHRIIVKGNTSIDDGNWHHVAFTYDGSTLASGVKIYVDSVLDNTTILVDNLGNNTIQTTESIKIGIRNADTSYFNGSIDEIAIFNDIVNNTEIKDMYKRGLVKLNLSVRSCDDALCAGETWNEINYYSPQSLNLINNSYFQYKIDFTTDNVSYSPTMYNVSVQYGSLIPSIYDVNATPSDTTAVITWETDKLSNSSVIYGIDKNNLNLSVGQDDSVTSHSINLNNLLPTTTYFYNVTSCYGTNCNTSIQYNFTTLVPTFPIITNVHNSTTGTTEIYIEWNTDVNSNSSVSIFGFNTSFGQNDAVTSHSVYVNGLEYETTYFYNVTSCFGTNCNTSSVYNFTTINTPPTPTPQNLTISDYADTWIKLEWSNSMPVLYTEVWYSLDEQSWTLGSTLTDGEIALINGLNPARVYYFNVTSYTALAQGSAYIEQNTTGTKGGIFPFAIIFFIAVIILVLGGASYLFEMELRPVFLLLTALLIVFGIHMLAILSSDLTMTKTITDNLWFAYKISLYLFYGFLLYILTKITIALRIRKNPPPKINSPLALVRQKRKNKGAYRR